MDLSRLSRDEAVSDDALGGEMMNLISPEEVCARFRVLYKRTVEHVVLPEFRSDDGRTLPAIVLLSPPNFRLDQPIEWEAGEELLGFHWFLSIWIRTRDEETESRILLCLLDEGQRREAELLVAGAVGSDGRLASSKAEVWLLWRVGGLATGLVDPIRFSITGLAMALLTRAIGPEDGATFFSPFRMADCPRCRGRDR